MRRHYKGISINTSHNTHETVFSLVKKSPELIIADIPSGSGAFVRRLLDAGFGHVYALDIENILAFKHEPFIVADMTKPFPLKDESLDVVVCIDGIEHISRQFDFVKETHRVLRNKGELIISTPNISSLRSRWKWFTTGHHHKCNSPLNERKPSPLHHIGMISFPEMRYLLHSNGFRITTVTTNRIKAISWLYALFWPLIFLSTWWVYKRTGKDHDLQEINREVMKTMFTWPVLFGETLIVKAIKQPGRVD